jgi:hypothetical protein
MLSRHAGNATDGEPWRPRKAIAPPPGASPLCRLPLSGPPAYILVMRKKVALSRWRISRIKGNRGNTSALSKHRMKRPRSGSRSKNTGSIARTISVALQRDPMLETHKVIKTEVIQHDDELYGVAFTFDDGAEDYGVAGSKEAAEFYAKHQKGEGIPDRRESHAAERREG